MHSLKATDSTEAGYSLCSSQVKRQTRFSLFPRDSGFVAEAEHRADLDLHIGLLTEHELTRVLHMLDAMQDKMGIENDTDSELADLEAEIARLQQRAYSSNLP
jgi:hypothetical protein